MNRTPDQIIDAMEVCCVDHGANGFLIGDNEMARLVLEWRNLKTALDAADEFRQLFVADTDPASLDFDFSESSPDVMMTLTQSWDEADKASKEAREAKND
jgi:hypothetical protein